MGNVVISGYYGSKNAGDEAMLAAMLEVFTDLDPQVNITVISSCPEETKKRHGVDAIHWLDFAAIVKSLLRADILISGGGSLLQDVTSRRSLYYYLFIIVLAMVAGTKVMLYAQGIGPIRGTVARHLMRLIGNRIDLITVRDHGSTLELESLGITKPHIEETADPVLAIHQANTDVGQRIISEHRAIGDKPLVGISVREWCGLHSYKETIARLVDSISEEFGADIVFLPMQYPDDVRVAESIAAMSRCDAVVLDGDYDTYQLLSIVGKMDILIAIRLHALIFAGVMGVPMIGVSYDPKVDRFLESLGEKAAGRIEDISHEELMSMVRRHWNDKKGFKEKNTKLFSKLRELAVKNGKLAFDLIKNNIR